MEFRVLVALLLLHASSAVVAAAPIIPPAPSIAAKSFLLIDAATSEVLVEHNSHEALAPASLTKLMTSYVASV